MKNYKNVEMFAKNAPTGSYAAGCPTQEKFSGSARRYNPNIGNYESCYCSQCEIAG